MEYLNVINIINTHVVKLHYVDYEHKITLIHNTLQYRKDDNIYMRNIVTDNYIKQEARIVVYVMSSSSQASP